MPGDGRGTGVGLVGRVGGLLPPVPGGRWGRLFRDEAGKAVRANAV
jgi:hypothetical protein